MVEIGDSKVIRDAIAAGQAEATQVSLRESDGDDATVHGLQEAVIDLPAFKGFTDFDLDLSCLSPPPSPPASIYTDARTDSPPASPRQSVSFHSSSASRSPAASPRKSPPPRLPRSAANSIVRGSWPLMRYVGRGTPIDRNRRIEWGAIGSEDVGEDGVLFSTVRSTSLDSALRPSQRSVSPEWNILSRRPSTLPNRARSRAFAPEPETLSPAIQIEGLGTESPGEWASFMQTVLGNSSEPTSASTSASTSQLPAPVVQENIVAVPKAGIPARSSMSMSPEEIRQLDAGIDIDLGIDAALDLGLGYRGGMNWFDLGMLPPSGRETPSVYSSHPPSLLPSRPPSITPPDNRSTASTKAEPAIIMESKSDSAVWWRKLLRRLKKVHLLLGSH